MEMKSKCFSASLSFVRAQVTQVTFGSYHCSSNSDCCSLAGLFGLTVSWMHTEASGSTISALVFRATTRSSPIIDGFRRPVASEFNLNWMKLWRFRRKVPGFRLVRNNYLLKFGNQIKLEKTATRKRPNRSSKLSRAPEGSSSLLRLAWRLLVLVFLFFRMGG